MRRRSDANFGCPVSFGGHGHRVADDLFEQARQFGVRSIRELRLSALRDHTEIAQCALQPVELLLALIALVRTEAVQGLLRVFDELAGEERLR